MVLWLTLAPFQLTWPYPLSVDIILCTTVLFHLFATLFDVYWPAAHLSHMTICFEHARDNFNSLHANLFAIEPILRHGEHTYIIDLLVGHLTTASYSPSSSQSRFFRLYVPTFCICYIPLPCVCFPLLLYMLQTDPLLLSPVASSTYRLHFFTSLNLGETSKLYDRSIN